MCDYFITKGESLLEFNFKGQKMENLSNIALDNEREWFELVESERAERERFDELDRRIEAEYEARGWDDDCDERAELIAWDNARRYADFRGW